MKIIHLNADRGVHPERSKGAAVHLMAMREAFDELGHEVIPIDQPQPALITTALQAANLGTPVDMLYERLSLGAYCGSNFARTHRVPHVIEINAPLDEEAARHRESSHEPPDQEQLGEMLQAADLLLCVSKDCASWARSKGAAESRILVAGNGVDAERFHPRRRAEGALSKFLTEDEFVIGFHGRLRPWHGFERLASATGELIDRGLKLHLVMIGKGEFKNAIGTRIDPRHWTHLSWVEHQKVGAFVARFDVLPLSYDPNQPCYFSPLKLLEGMAAGAVAVVPNLGDLASAVNHGKAGLIYDPHDPSALANAIDRIYRDPATRKHLALEGRRAAEQHSWLSIASSVLCIVGDQSH